MITDPISDLLTRIKNAYMARKETVIAQHSNEKAALVNILRDEGYVRKVTVEKKDGKQILSMTLHYEGKQPRLTVVRRISKPGRRVYVGHDAIPTVLGGMGTVILSTPKGIMTGREAKKKGVGGEVMCKVW